MSTPLNASVLKCFEILDLISRSRPEITAAVVAEEMDLNVATAHRFLLTLESAGALRSHRRGAFSLGETIERLGRIADEINPLAGHIQPLISVLSRELGESVMACRMGRYGPVCIAAAAAAKPISVTIEVGTVLKSPFTAQGRLWLSELGPSAPAAWLRDLAELPSPEDLEGIRQAGFARNRGESENGIGAVCIPIRSHSAGKMVLSISVFGLLSQFDDDLAALSLKALNRAAKAFTAQIGAS